MEILLHTSIDDDSRNTSCKVMYDSTTSKLKFNCKTIVCNSDNCYIEHSQDDLPAEKFPFQEMIEKLRKK